MERLSLKEEKTALRQKFRGERETYAAVHGSKAVAGLHANLKKWMKNEGVQFEQMCAYRASEHEIDPCAWPLTQLYFPRINGKDLSFWIPSSPDAFTTNSMGIFEPSPDAALPLDLKRPTVVFTPALAVDSLGRRIGYGAGYYDRFFQTNPKAVRVGVVYHVQVSHDPLPAEGWDQLLDWVITDRMILRVSRRSS